MNKLFFILLAFVFVSLSFANNEGLTADQEAQLATLFEILQYVYEDDPSAIPSDANDIAKLKTSTDSKDTLALALLEMMEAIQKGELNLFVDAETENTTIIEAAPIVSDEAAELFLPAELFGGFVTTSMLNLEAEEELFGPLESCILEPRTYRIHSLPLQITGYVVIPAGTTLISPYDPNNAIIEVMPGGLLETGKAAAGTVWTDPNILPPVVIEPSDPNILFVHNRCGIHIHRGADPKTQIENVIIKNCTMGILVDEKLESAVENVIMFGCYDGIWVCAPATIRNCLSWMNGTVFAGALPYIGTGIYVWLDWAGDADVVVDRVTLYGGDVMLYVEGGGQDPNSNDPNQVIPKVSVVNSALTAGQFYGLYQSPGQACIDVQHCGFGGNYYGASNIYFPDTTCVYLGSNPFYNRQQDWEKLYVYPWSLLIDNGYGLAADGTGVNPDQPDIGQLDIGCHFSIGRTGVFGVPACPADFNGDGIVNEADLELMNRCMGAVTDPNIVQLDGNYDSLIDLPDFGLFAADFGYCSDPNFCFNNDPNCRRSDFNGDNWVDIGDLAILAGHWLEPVFDEYRVCSLCNLRSADDPNLPEIVDDEDMAAFMAEWGKQYTFEPNIVIEYSASMLSVAVTNPDPAWKISAFLDEALIGQWENWDLEGPVFGADMMRFGPGSHRLKIVRNINNGLEITERVITDPNSTGLYFANIPDTFEPNEPYILRGFNLGYELNVRIYNIWDEPIYDVNIPSGAVNLQIPPETFGADRIFTVRLEGGGSAPEGFGLLAMSEGASVAKRDLVKPFDPNDWDHKRPRAVIICPDTHWWNGKDIFVQRRPAILAAARAFENQGINYCVLYKKDVTPANLRFVLGNRSMRYVYWVGHGNDYVGNPEIPRTSVNCWKDGKKVPAFSYTRNTIPDVPALVTAAGNNYDQIGFDLNTITINTRPMSEARTKRLVVIDACSSCRFKSDDLGLNDMAWVFGAYIYDPGFPLIEHMNYIGWEIDVAAGGGTFFNDDTTDRMVDFWEVLGTGNNLALAYERNWNNSATATASVSLLPTFFGDDELNQYGKGDDTFKREGCGLKEQKLEN